MFDLFDDIGCAAGIVPFHATRLTIEGHDSAGAGSADLDGDEDEGNTIVADEDFGDEDSADDQPRGTRSRRDRAYDDLKSQRDRLQQELDRKDREFAERLSALEGQRETRQQVNDRANAGIEKAKLRAREVVNDIKKLDKSDPDYAEKVYEAMFSRVYTDLPQEAEEISRRTSSEVYRETATREELKAKAEQEALDALEEVGLSKDHLKLVRFVAREKMETEGEAWFRNTPKEEQVPKLVKEVVTMLRGEKRNSQEFRDEKRRHRESMDGVIGEGSRSSRRTTRDDDNDDRAEGPGSMLADLARFKERQRKQTALMMRDR